MFFSLPNLVATSVSECPSPWTFTQKAPDSVAGKENKKERDRWISNPNREWQCYSAFEGVNSAVRVSEPKAGDEGNPPFKLHAFVADIDAPVSEDELAAGIGRLGDFTPNYYERTLSGNARLLWLLERPVTFPNRRFAVEFLKLAWSKLRVEQIAAAVDRPAWDEPNRYFTNSGDWRVINADVKIPHSLLQGWVVEVSEKHLWKKDRGAVDIPLPVVWVELQKKFPAEAASWPGDFVEGATGPTFWVPGSSSPKSAVVKATGLYTFSAHAHKPFFGWADLLGKDFVEKYQAEAMGKAVEGIYHDGKTYFRKDGFSDWKAFAKEDIILHLSTDRGLSTTKADGMPSETNRALSYVQNWQGVNGAAPFVFQPTGVLERNGTKFLNTHTRKVVTPAGEKTIWGASGQMPFLSAFFDGFFHKDSKPARPLEYFLAWLSRFYQGAYSLSLESGQNAFFLGAAGVGKTFLNQGVLPHLMGGAAEAESYLLGKSDFNSDLFEVGLWTVDDNSATVDLNTHRKFSSMLKKMAANTTFQYHAKFRIPCPVDWCGRVSITANDDEESVRIVPDLSISNMDKLHLWRVAPEAAVKFPSLAECRRIIRDEAPHFARLLLDYIPPAHVVGTARFGVVAYHEEQLLKVAERSSRTASFLEILDDFRQSYFSDHVGAKSWEGTAFKLLKEMHRDELSREAGLRGLTPVTLAMQLAAVKSRGCDWLESAEDASARRWIILPPSLAEADTLPVAVKSKFSKSTQT